MLLCGCLWVWLALVLGLPVSAHGFTFGPTVGGLGPEEVVYDQSTEKCEEWDIPDQPARAFRDDRGQVQLHFAHHEARRNIAVDLDTASSQGHHDCVVRSWSPRDPDPSHYDNFSWVASPYTLDGRTVYSLMHTEFRGWNYVERCPIPPYSPTACWYNAITLSTSDNSGDLFTHAPLLNGVAQHLVASQPDPWVDGTGPYGLFAPSNIVKKTPDDGYYYTLVRSKPPGELDVTCAMRTNDLSDPSSWRAWDGSGYNVRFINPYVDTPANRADHLCKGLTSLGFLNAASESLTYNTHFGKYILVGATGNHGHAGAGFYYALSDDLINWSAPRLLLSRETQQSWQCGDADPVRDPSLLDPTSTDRNFETTGRRPYLYYKIFNLNGGCSLGPDRDLIRIRIEFDPSPPAPPPSPSTPPAIGTTSAPVPTVQPRSQAPKTSCTASTRRARLTRQLRNARRKLSRARTRAAKRRYRRQVRSLNKRLKGLRSTAC